MRFSRVAVTVAYATALGLAGCTPGTPVPAGAPPTTRDVGPHACTYLTDTQARAALGIAELPRKTASTTDSAQTYCIYRTDDPNTELVVSGGGGGSPAFTEVLELAERDLAGKRAEAAGVADGYVVTGAELGVPVIIVGAIRGQHWFTAALRATGTDPTTLGNRAMAVLKVGVERLENT